MELIALLLLATSAMVAGKAVEGIPSANTVPVNNIATSSNDVFIGERPYMTAVPPNQFANNYYYSYFQHMYQQYMYMQYFDYLNKNYPKYMQELYDYTQQMHNSNQAIVHPQQAAQNPLYQHPNHPNIPQNPNPSYQHPNHPKISQNPIPQVVPNAPTKS